MGAFWKCPVHQGIEGECQSIQQAPGIACDGQPAVSRLALYSCCKT